MSNENNLSVELKVILARLRTLELTLNNSINYTEGLNLTYPMVSRDYNQILNRIKELAKRDPALKLFVDNLDNFEEKDFSASGNYKYAVNLQTVIRILKSNLSSLNLNSKAEIIQEALVPIVFISYATEELALADFIKKVICRLVDDKIEVFIAKRDIPPGDNPLKVMMESKLKLAQAIIPVCSLKSKESPWVWWESAAVWARNKGIYPLFINISPGKFGAPLNLVTQGKEYFDIAEFKDTLGTLFRQLKIANISVEFIPGELSEYKKLKEEYLKEKSSARINLAYAELEIKPEIHKYSLVFEVENIGERAFEDIALDLYFPIDYLEDRTEWNYPHLNSYLVKDKPGYICLTFMFSALNEAAKLQFKKDLLVGKKLRIFAEDGISRLHYRMTHDLWDKRFNFEIQWKVYINGGAPQEGSKPLNSIQIF